MQTANAKRGNAEVNLAAKYPSSILEEELKNKVAADFFGAFDCSRILGKVDFCAAVPATDLPLCDAESVLWAEAKRGANLLDSHVFQFDFLNDPFDKLPPGLNEIIDDPEKRRRLVIYINPPYAEAGDIRQAFHGKLEKCFIVPADTFDNVKGDFPIGFFVWRLSDEAARAPLPREGAHPRGSDTLVASSVDTIFTSAVANVYDRKGEFVGTKTLLSYDKERSINDWLIETRKRHSRLQLGFLSTRAHDVQDINTIYIKRDKALIKSARGSWITDANLTESAVYVAVCHSVEVDWLNDRDQFLYPNDGWRNDFGFQWDCLVYTLFSDFNVIKSKDGMNHWIPFTEEEVGAKDCFASHFMSDFINGRAASPLAAAAGAGRPPYQGDLFAAAGAGRPPYQGDLFAAAVAGRPPYQGDLFAETPNPNLENPVNPVKNSSADSAPLRLCVKESLSPAARAVLDAGRELWRYYHAQQNANPNASYYDIRLHFQGMKRTASGKEQMNATSSDIRYNELISALRSAHKALARQIEPKVYEYGFLKR